MNARDMFRGTAWYYARYRPDYPEAFFQHVRDEFRLDGTGRLLDLGCGTGQVAFPLAKDFAEVVGMDPEPEMLSEARTQAEHLGVRNVTWVQGGSKDLKALALRLGYFHLVTMGSSFHWMDRKQTLVDLYEMVLPCGGIVVVSEGAAIPWTAQGGWQKAVIDVIKQFLDSERRAGSANYVVPLERHEIIVEDSPFKGRQVFEIDYQRSWTIEAIIGYLYSTSYCSLALLGNLQERFERELRVVLERTEPCGEFIEEVHHEAVLAYKAS